MYDSLKSLVGQLLMPAPLLLSSLLLGLLLWRSRPRIGWGLCVLSALGLLLASWAPLADRLLGVFEDSHPVLLAPPEDVQAVVVLGGGWQPEEDWGVVGRLNSSSQARLMEGLRLWQLARGEEDRELLPGSATVPLIVSGVSPRGNRVPVALGYAEAAMALGVPQSALIPLTEPSDTGKEARAVASALAEPGATVVLVTSASHLPRAMVHFCAAGLTPIPAPAEFLARRDSANTLGYWVPASRHLGKTERAWYELLGHLALNWEAGTCP